MGVSSFTSRVKKIFIYTFSFQHAAVGGYLGWVNSRRCYSGIAARTTDDSLGINCEVRHFGPILDNQAQIGAWECGDISGAFRILDGRRHRHGLGVEPFDPGLPTTSSRKR